MLISYESYWESDVIILTEYKEVSFDVVYILLLNAVRNLRPFYGYATADYFYYFHA